MSWKINYLGELEPGFDFDKMNVGDAFSLDLSKFKDKEDGHTIWPAFYVKHLSDYYKQNNAHRLPILVVMPGRTLFCVDSQCFASPQGYYGGWTVQGSPDNLTVTPSINMQGRYHGWITNGVITDDCEGRTFPEDPNDPDREVI